MSGEEVGGSMWRIEGGEVLGRKVGIYRDKDLIDRYESMIRCCDRRGESREWKEGVVGGRKNGWARIWSRPGAARTILFWSWHS